MTIDLVTVGEAMGVLASERIGPLRLGGPMRLSMAGAETTVAIGVARLGGTARWIGVIGDDEVGRLVTRTLAAENVRTDGVVVDPTRPTGLFLKERRSASTSRISYYRRGMAGSRLSPSDVRHEFVAGARVVHVSGITPALSESARDATLHALEVAEAVGALRSVDVNYRRALWQLEPARSILTDMVRRADVVLATVEETALLTSCRTTDPYEAAESIGRLGPGLAVVKSGADGAVAWERGRRHRVRPRPTEEVDPVGAGDAFAAGLLAELARGLPTDEALATAAEVAAIGVACHGDWEGLPTRSEVELLRGGDVHR